MSVMDAAFNVAEDYPHGGAAGLARAIGKNPTTFSHEVKETGGAKLGLHTAVKMTKRTGDLRILLEFAAECGQMLIPLPEAVDSATDDCMQALASTSREFGEMCQRVCESLGDDGQINDNEMAQIQREGGELFSALHKLMSAARARNFLSRQHAQTAPGAPA